MTYCLARVSADGRREALCIGIETKARADKLAREIAEIGKLPLTVEVETTSFHVVCVRTDGNGIVVCSVPTRSLAEAAVRILRPGFSRIEIVEADEPPVILPRRAAGRDFVAMT